MKYDNAKQCKFCGREKENNPGDMYHFHACWRNDVLKRMDECAEGDYMQMKKLESELWHASYTGD